MNTELKLNIMLRATVGIVCLATAAAQVWKTGYFSSSIPNNANVIAEDPLHPGRFIVGTGYSPYLWEGGEQGFTPVVESYELSDEVLTILVVGQEVWVGGSFDNDYSADQYIGYVIRRDANGVWGPVVTRSGAVGLGNSVEAMKVCHGELYLSGECSSAIRDSSCCMPCSRQRHSFCVPALS